VNPPRAGQQHLDQGFTLIEVLVTVVLLAVVLTVVVNLVLSGLKISGADQGRVAANGNVRGTMDVLSSDVRQAGENLSDDFPGLGVTTGANGSVLTVYRAWTDAPFTLCAPVSGSTIEVTAASSNTSAVTYADGSTNLPAACKNDSTSLAGVAATLTTWRSLITSGLTGGYLYDPGTQLGGFVRLTGTTATQVNYSGLLPSNSTYGWNPLKPNQAGVTRDQRLYLLEKRVYSFNGSRLQLAINDAAPADAAANISSFVTTPYVTATNGTVIAATLPFPNATQSWRSLAYLDVQLGSTQPAGFNRTVNRTLTYRLYPRNAGSSNR